MKTVEERVHEALTRLAAALDWSTRAMQDSNLGGDCDYYWDGHPGDAYENAQMGGKMEDRAMTDREAVDGEMRKALTLLDSCWSYCENCRDRTWIEDLMWSKDAERLCCGACHQEAHLQAHGPSDPRPYPYEIEGGIA